MRKAVVIIAIAAMLACIIPLVDSSDATGETTISGYLYEGSKDISTASNIYICIIYSADEGATGKIVGETETVGTMSLEKNTNRFTISIEPEADLAMDHYYVYINIYGYSVRSAPESMTVLDKINVDDKTYNNCYQMSGTNIIENTDNVIGNANTGWFIMKSARGTVAGKVSMNTQDPTYLTGVRVTLFDLKTKEDIKEATDVTDNNGYRIEYNTGTYGIRFEMGGYDTVEQEVTIIENAVVQLPVTMKENQSYYGLDLPHALMIVAGSLAVILVLYAVIRRVRM